MKDPTIKYYLGLSLLVMFLAIGTAYPQVDQPWDLSTVKSRRVVSKVELLIGPSVIYQRKPDVPVNNQVLKIGYAVNFGLIHQFNSRLDINLKFRYENKGVRSVSHSLNPDSIPPAKMRVLDDRTLNYVTVSLLPKYSIDKKGRLSFGVGPFFGYLLEEKAYQELYINDIPIYKDRFKPDPYSGNKEFDGGLTVLLAYNFFARQKLFGTVQLVHNRGLIDINQPMITRKRNNTFSLMLGFTFNRTSVQ